MLKEIAPCFCNRGPSILAVGIVKTELSGEGYVPNGVRRSFGASIRRRRSPILKDIDIQVHGVGAGFWCLNTMVSLSS